MNYWLDAFTVLDFETTGVDTDKARAIEIGIVRFERGVEVEACNYLVNPCGSEVPVLEPKVTEITGIRGEDLRGQPDFYAVWGQVADMFRGAAVLAYNAPYDRRVFCNELRRERRSWPAVVLEAAHLSAPGALWLDPLPYARRADRYAGPKKLVDCCNRRNIPVDQAHRAVDDARASGRLWLALAAEMQIVPQTAAAVAQGEQFRLDELVNLKQYGARKDGQSRLVGNVYVCDVCNDTQWCEKDGALPDGWATFRDPTGGLVTCSSGCDAQLLWWNKARQGGG